MKRNHQKDGKIQVLVEIMLPLWRVQVGNNKHVIYYKHGSYSISASTYPLPFIKKKIIFTFRDLYTISYTTA